MKIDGAAGFELYAVLFLRIGTACRFDRDAVDRPENGIFPDRLRRIRVLLGIADELSGFLFGAGGGDGNQHGRL